MPRRILDTGCGMGRAATMFLLERGIGLCGTDAWFWALMLREE